MHITIALEHESFGRCPSLFLSLDEILIAPSLAQAPVLDRFNITWRDVVVWVLRLAQPDSCQGLGRITGLSQHDVANIHPVVVAK